MVTLDSLIDDASFRLGEGANSRRSPFHTPSVATVNDDGAPDQRIMVLRNFDPATWSLRFHTDARSPKIGQVSSRPIASALFYDAAAKIQIRIRGRAETVTEGPLRDKVWEQSTTFARRCYLTRFPPSDRLDYPTSGLPAELDGINPTEEQVAPGKANFAFLQIATDTVDYLHLANEGHRRMSFAIDESRKPVAATWLAP